MLDENSTVGDWEKLFLDVYNTKSNYLDQDYLRKDGLVPTFHVKNDAPKHLVIKSTRYHNLVPHILERINDIRFIHIVRDPCATIYSWLSSPYEFPKNADPLVEWRTGACRKNGPGEYWGFDDWKYVNKQALHLAESYPDRFKIIRYEDLVRYTEKYIREVFAFLNIEYESQTSEFIGLSKNKHDSNRRSVFKRNIIKNGWVEKLDKNIVSKCINEIKGTELEIFVEKEYG